MKNPTQCALWEKPELIDEPSKGRFEVIETFADDSHFWRHLLKCRECGQLYFFEFYEWIDWEKGEDPQYSTFIPVETDEEVEMLKKSSPLELLQYSPRLQKDFPKEAKQPTLRWIGK